MGTRQQHRIAMLREANFTFIVQRQPTLSRRLRNGHLRRRTATYVGHIRRIRGVIDTRTVAETATFRTRGHVWPSFMIAPFPRGAKYSLFQSVHVCDISESEEPLRNRRSIVKPIPQEGQIILRSVIKNGETCIIETWIHIRLHSLREQGIVGLRNRERIYRK